MGTNGHTITVGDRIPATVNGERRILTVTRIAGHGILYTDDWRAWWYRQPDHADGTPVHGTTNALHLEERVPALVLVEAMAA